MPKRRKKSTGTYKPNDGSLREFFKSPFMIPWSMVFFGSSTPVMLMIHHAAVYLPLWASIPVIGIPCGLIGWGIYKIVKYSRKYPLNKPIVIND